MISELVTSRQPHHTRDGSLPVGQCEYERLVDEAFAIQFVGAIVVAPGVDPR